MQSAESGTQYRLFQVAVILKGINGILELIGGLALVIVGSRRINHWLDLLTSSELDDSPHGLLLKILTNHGIPRHIGPVNFAVIYLLVNGVVKVAIVSALMRRKRKVFPYAMAFLGIFVLYGLGRLVTHHSIILAAAMTLDIIVIALIWREYKALEAEEHEGKRHATGRVATNRA